jgi:hypothetical protein
VFATSVLAVATFNAKPMIALPFAVLPVSRLPEASCRYPNRMKPHVALPLATFPRRTLSEEPWTRMPSTSAPGSPFWFALFCSRTLALDRSMKKPLPPPLVPLCMAVLWAR